MSSLATNSAAECAAFACAGHHPSRDSPPGPGACAVCGDHADGHHYGVLSCRGCNAFFRRAVTFNLQFHCRREGRCEINKNARCACRACRLHKCQAVGMDRAAVQVRREMKDVLALGDDTRQDFRHCPADLFSLNNNHAQQAAATGVDQFPTNSPVFGAARLLDMPETKSCLLGSVSLTAGSPRAAEQHPVDRQIRWYFCQRYRRQTMLCQTVEQILRAGIGGTDGRTPHRRLTNPATADDLCQMNRVQAVLMFEWADQLEEFGQLEEPVDKTRLLRAFSPRYLLLDTLMHTLECGFTDRLVLPNPNGAFVRPGERPHHVEEGGGWGPEQRAMEILFGDSLAAPLIHSLLPALLSPPGLSFGDFVALRSLLFWDCTVPLRAPAQRQLVAGAAERARREAEEWAERNWSGVGGANNIGVGGATSNGVTSGEEARHRVEWLCAEIVPRIREYADRLARVCAMLPEFGVMPEWQFMADLLEAGDPGRQ